MTQPPAPGYPQQPPAGQAPDNYLVWSILATIFCCPATGIAAIIKSTQVSGLWAQGQHAEAQASAAAAKKWVRWSVILWVILVVIVVIIQIIVAVTATNPPEAMAMIGAMF
jgi:hypothetical protein